MSLGWPDRGSGWAVVGSERPGRADVAMRHGRESNLVVVMAILSFVGLRWWRSRRSPLKRACTVRPYSRTCPATIWAEAPLSDPPLRHEVLLV